MVHDNPDSDFEVDHLASEIADTELSIGMPCLNEAETLQTCIAKCQRVLHDNAISGEIIDRLFRRELSLTIATLAK